MISIVLPVYNEESNIKRTIDSILSYVQQHRISFEIIAVNDGSSDNTAVILEQYARQKVLTTVSHQQNKGYGAALRTGFSRAQGDIVFFMDSDGQISIKDLSPFLDAIQSCDFVIGWRRNRQDSFLRKCYAQILRIVARTVFKVRVYDIDCAFKLFRKTALDKLPLQENGALINLELLALAVRRKYAFCQLPVNHFRRTGGRATGGSFTVLARAAGNFLLLYFRLLTQSYE